MEKIQEFITYEQDIRWDDYSGGWENLVSFHVPESLGEVFDNISMHFGHSIEWMHGDTTYGHYYELSIDCGEFDEGELDQLGCAEFIETQQTYASKIISNLSVVFEEFDQQLCY
jgi:hypothetical protein